jgi:hypothetical protein
MNDGNPFFSVFDSLFGMGAWAEPPDTVPLRILGISADHRPSHEHIRHMFRAKVKAAHPDLQPEDWHIRNVDAADVQELVWARDVLQRKFPPPPDPATVAASARTRGLRASRNKCPVCKDEHDEPHERPHRKRGRWRGYCERCARDAENARQREIRRFLRAHDQNCGGCGFVPADRHNPPSESPFVSHRKCNGCGGVFTPKRSDGRFCSNACRKAAYRQRVKANR